MSHLDLNEPIAIVGLGCYFPDAPNCDSYWKNIVENRSFIEPITDESLGLGPIYDSDPLAWNKSTVKIGARVMPFQFPYKRFRGLPPTALDACDYHFKYGLVAAQDAIDDAGFTDDQSSRDKVFVVVGANSYETPMLRDYSNSLLYYRLDEFRQTESFLSLAQNVQKAVLDGLKQDYFKIHQKLSVDALTASMSGALASRVAKLNRFCGGHTAVDAACASSLAAVDIGIKKLRSRSADAVVAGGIGGIVPFFYIYCSKAKTMSPHGSFPFDTRASGFAVGEGAGFVVMKRLSDALRAHDKIHGVIRGIGASSDGSKTAPWAPNKEGQKLAMLRALKQVPYSIRDLQYIECHGTGTKVGDVEELSGIGDLIVKAGPAPFEGKIAIGSAKGAVGHLLTGAGMAGLFRSLLSIKNKSLPPTAGVKNLIPELLKPDSPFFVPQSIQPWPLPQGDLVRRAMVNSFGFGGTNFNVQVEEFSQAFHESYLSGDSDLFKSYRLRKLPYSEITIENSSDVHNVPIAIVAIAVDLPGSRSLKSFSDNLKSGATFISEPPKDRWDTEIFSSKNKNSDEKWKTLTTRGGFVALPERSERLRWKIPPVVLDHLDPNQFRLYRTVEEALKQSGLLGKHDILQNTAMICGNMMDSDFLFKEHASVRFHYFADFIDKHFPDIDMLTKRRLILEFFERIKGSLHTIGADNSTSGIDSMLGSRVAKFFDLKGGSIAFDAVCATGVVAFDHACKALRSREIEAAVVCSSNMGMSGPLFCTYNDLTALSRSNEIRPFDRRRDGMLLGEGSVAFVLRRLPDAITEGSHIHALVHASATSTDGGSLQMLAPVKPTVKQAFDAAIEDFGPGLPAVEFVECHGSGTVVGDQVEMECCAEVYGRKAKEAKDGPVVIGSVKSSIGHLKVASAFASVAKVALSLKDKVIYPTVNHEEPDPYLEANSDLIRVDKKATPYKADTPFAAVNSMGLGGVNGHMLLSAYDERRWLKKNNDDAPAKIHSDKVDDAYSIKILYKTDQELLVKQKKAIALAKVGAVDLLRKDGIYLLDEGLARQGGKLAFMFPGQSSAYAGMYRSLVSRADIFKQLLSVADRFCQKVGRKALSDVVYGCGNESLLADLFYSQIAPYTFQIATATMLIERWNIRPDYLVGHSVGEFAAAGVSGAYDFETGLEILFQRSLGAKKLLDEGQAKTKMLVLRTNEDGARSLIAGVDGVYLANVNTKEQVVLSGFMSVVEEVRDLALNRGIDVKELTISQAFHSPILLPAVMPFRKFLDGISYQPMRIPCSSLVLQDFNSDQAKLPELFSEALVSPVYFEKLIDRAWALGARLFVDIGPGAPLRNMCEKIDKPKKAFFVNHAKEDAIESFNKFIEEHSLWAYPKRSATVICGSARERGIIQGRLWRERFTDYKWAWDRMPSETTNNHDDAVKNLERQTPPEYLEEVKGIAEGANVSLETVELINSLSSIATSRYGLCSGFVAGAGSVAAPIHAANYDFPFITAQDAGRLPRAVLLMKTEDRIPFLGVFKLGSPLPLCGMNEQGLSISTCAGSPSGTLCDGINAHALIRMVLENCSTLQEVIEFVSKRSIEGAWILLVLSSKENKAVRIECRGDERSVVSSDSADCLATNHFQTLKDGLPVREDSVHRLKRLKELYSRGVEQPAQAMAILADGFDMERGRVPRFATKNTLNRYNTSASVVFDPFHGRIFASCDGIPSGSGPYLEYSFDGKETDKKAPPCVLPSSTLRWVTRVGLPIDLELGENTTAPNASSNIFVMDNDTERFPDRAPETIIDLGLAADFDVASFDLFLKKVSLLRRMMLQGWVPRRIICVGTTVGSFYKSLRIEFPEIECCLVDVRAKDVRAKMDKEKIIELAHKISRLPVMPPELIVLGGKHYASKHVLKPIRPILRADLPKRGETFLITGGAGGITAEIGLHLASQFPGKYILLGRSRLPSDPSEPKPPEQLDQRKWIDEARQKRPGLKPVEYMALFEKEKRVLTSLKNIERYEGLAKCGVEVHYYDVDLTDRQSCLSTLAEIIKEHGPIHHLVHGAGTQRSKRFLDKSEAEFKSIFSSKTFGTLNLLDALAGQPLKSAIFFGSVSGINGNIGQTDYSAANAVHTLIGPYVKERFLGSFVKIISWPAWAETGMATDGAVLSEMKTAGIGFIDIHDGVNFFLNEFTTSNTDDAVICTADIKNDATTALTTYGGTEYKDFAIERQKHISDLPYVDYVHSYSRDHMVFEKFFSGMETFLQDHIVRGVPTVPGVVLTEIAIQCASLLESKLSQIIINEIRFLNACIIPPKYGATLRILFERTASGFRFNIASPKRRSDGAVLLYDFIHCDGIITISQADASIGQAFQKPTSSQIENKASFYRKLLSKFPEHLGESFHTLTAVFESKPGEIVTRGFYPNTAAFGIGKFFFHASIFDLMNHSVVEYEPVRSGDLVFLPYEFRDVRLGHPFVAGSEYYIRLSNLSLIDDSIRFKAEFFDESGCLVLSVGQVTHRKYSIWK